MAKEASDKYTQIAGCCQKPNTPHRPLLDPRSELYYHNSNVRFLNQSPQRQFCPTAGAMSHTTDKERWRMAESALTPESALAKLVCLLGAGRPVAEVRDMVGVDLAGELTPTDST